MDINISGAYIYFKIPILGGINVTQTMLSVLIVTVTLCIAAVILGKNLQKRPDGRQVLVEKGVTMLMNLVSSTMGAHNLRWVPYLGTIFLSSLAGSLVGLLGFTRSTTADLSVPLTWGVMTSVVIWAQSIKQNGFLGWLKGFAEPIPVMLPINLISEIVQPFAMALRHFGNVAGGGIISSMLYTALGLLSTVVITAISQTVALPVILVVISAVLVIRGVKGKRKKSIVFGAIFGVLALVGLLQHFGLLTGIPIFQYGIPAVLSVYFDLFSGFIQAFVFTLLSMVYIAGVCPPPGKEDIKAANN